MFGSQNNNDQQGAVNPPSTSTPPVQDTALSGTFPLENNHMDTSLPATPPPAPTFGAPAVDTPFASPNAPATPGSTDGDMPFQPFTSLPTVTEPASVATDSTTTPVTLDTPSVPPMATDPLGSPTPVIDTPSDVSADTPADTAASPDTPTESPDSDQLITIKQEALQKLSPLVAHLDQTPEERFKTTMMMLQATDDQNMVKDAYDAANAIQDDKARAQALLDVVNEINYFTQQKTKE